MIHARRPTAWTQAQREAVRLWISHAQPYSGTMLVENIEDIMPDGYRIGFEALFARLGVVPVEYPVSDSETTGTLVESVARAIYDAMRDYDHEGQRHPWVEGGNSLMQDEARRRARKALGGDATLRVVREGTW